MEIAVQQLVVTLVFSSEQVSSRPSPPSRALLGHPDPELMFVLFVCLFLFIYLCLVVLGLCCFPQTLSLVAASRCYFGSRCVSFSLWQLLLWITGSRRMGFSSCSRWTQWLWLLGSRAWAQQLWYMGLVALQHVESSRARDQTRVPHIGRQVLIHCTTREVPELML